MSEIASPDSILVCPEKTRIAIAHEGSLMGGIREAGPLPDTYCDPDCTGPVEMQRHRYSPLRLILGSTVKICPENIPSC